MSLSGMRAPVSLICGSPLIRPHHNGQEQLMWQLGIGCNWRVGIYETVPPRRCRALLPVNRILLPRVSLVFALDQLVFFENLRVFTRVPQQACLEKGTEPCGRAAFFFTHSLHMLQHPTSSVWGQCLAQGHLSNAQDVS